MIFYWVICFVLVGSCIVLLRRFGVIELNRKAFSITLESLGTIQSPVLNDLEKETALRKHSIQLFRLAFIMLPGIIGALLIPFLPVVAGHYLGVLSLGRIVSVICSPAFILSSTCMAIIFVSFKRQTDPSSAYSGLEQLLHRIAFRTGLAQIWLANTESRILARKLSPCSADNPVFITALPRSGTTLLLECLADHPALATHCYRDMPFVLSPYLWGRFSSRFRKKGERRERAHGDGMKIDFDSPEALEEVVWKNFWHEQYLSDRIRLWTDDGKPEFIRFFKDHLRKIICIRRMHCAGDVRYISKNNYNTARIDFLCRYFPESTIVIPFRDPMQHAASLLQQHKGFLNMHEEDPFVAEYMEAIGHFDFGVNLKPIDFDGWLDRCEVNDPLQPAFWLEYWQACYKHLLQSAGNAMVYFVHYDLLCRQPEIELTRLGRQLGLSNLDSLLRHAADIRPCHTHAIDDSGISESLRQSAYTIYRQLEKQSGETAGRPDRAISEDSFVGAKA